jgi:hypothetical protein
MRRRVEDTFSTRGTRATPFQYQGYSKATETRISVFRAAGMFSRLFNDKSIHLRNNSVLYMNRIFSNK